MKSWVPFRASTAAHWLMLVDQRLGAAGIADAPAGHGIGLGHAVDRQSTVDQVGGDLGDGGVFEVAIDEVLVHVVGQHPDVGVTTQNLGQGQQLRLGVGGAGRVGGAVQDQPLGLGRDGGLQHLGAQLEAVLLLADHGHGLAPGEQDHVGIGDPVGSRHDDLVAGVQGRDQGVEDDRLAARGDVDLRHVVGQAVLAGELGHDGLLQFGHAVGVGIFGLAAVNGVDGGLFDILRRVEVRLAGP